MVWRNMIMGIVACVLIEVLFAGAMQAREIRGEIFCAVEMGYMAKVEELLKVDPNLIDEKDYDGSTPLHWAAWKTLKNRTEVVKLLLAKGADVDAKDINGWTALHHVDYRIKTSSLEITKLLLAKGANVDAPPEEGFGGVDVLTRVGDCLFHLGRYKEAARTFEKCLEDYPRGSGRNYVTPKLGDCYVLLGQYDKARRTYKDAFEKYG